MTDPYSAPQAPPGEDSFAPVQPSLSEIARPVFLAWEKLRIGYVAVLAALTLVFAGPTLLVRPNLCVLVVEGAIAANVLFFAGPITETYVRWLGYNGGWVRWALYGCGTLFAMFLTVFELASVIFPGHH